MRKLIIAASVAVVSMLSTEVFAQTATDSTRKDTTKTQTATTTTAAPAASSDVTGVISGSADYANLTASIKAANLETALKDAGPYTVFAPNDAGFSKLPKTRTDSLMKNPAALSKILKTHVVSGKYTKADIITALKAGKGKATLKTLNGDNLTLSVNDKSNLQLTDAAGNTSLVTSFDMTATNGVVHGLNAPLIKP